MSVVVSEFEVVTAPNESRPAAGAGSAAQQQAQGPWAARDVAEGQRRLAERAARLEAY